MKKRQKKKKKKNPKTLNPKTKHTEKQIPVRAVQRNFLWW